VFPLLEPLRNRLRGSFHAASSKIAGDCPPLMADPSLRLLDEPSGGLVAAINRAADRRPLCAAPRNPRNVLIAEQNMPFALYLPARDVIYNSNRLHIRYRRAESPR